MITVYCGYQRTKKRVKFTSDRDCLSPDINCFIERTFQDMNAVKECVAELERAGFNVCADFEEWFYESEAA